MVLTEKDQEDFDSSTKCFICEESFTEKSKKVRDHCHLTGLYRGAACQHCNLNYKYPKFIPIVLHNLRSFDSHLIIQSIGLFKEHKITCIPNRMEKYISF